MANLARFLICGHLCTNGIMDVSVVGSNYSSGPEDEQTVPSVSLHSSCLSSSPRGSNMCLMPTTHILYRPVARDLHPSDTHMAQSDPTDAMASDAASYEQFTMSVHGTESLSSSPSSSAPMSTTATAEQHSAFNKVGLHRL